jgi:high-affinity iron transporter
MKKKPLEKNEDDIIDAVIKAPRKTQSPISKAAVIISLVLMGICVLAVLIWQAVTAAGSPDPTAEHLSKFAVVMDTGILVFREGLEAILVLAALTASLVRTSQGYWKPVSLGAGLSFLATVATWFIVVGIISNINAPELDIQAGTGLVAVVVLLIVMNWFFHKVYWTGWISHHNQRKQDIVGSSKPSSAVFKGLVLVGFTSVYREGFEVVLFLQNMRLKAGTAVVLEGVVIGLILTAMVAVLTFVAHQKLPYLKMLITTGIMLGMVMVVMVGESVQEMQLANWLPTTTLHIHMPNWLNIWFAIYPSAESLWAQALSIVLVVGSYFVSQYISVWRPNRVGLKKSR